MRMKLLIVSFFILVAAVMGGLPWFWGYCFKHEYLALIAGANRQFDSRIQVLEYHEGVFSSVAKFTIDLSRNGKSDSMFPGQVTIVEHITHGPYLHDPVQGWIQATALIRSWVHLDPKLEAQYLGANAKQGVMQFMTLVTNKHFVSQIQIPAIKTTDSSEAYSWQGLTGKIDVTDENDHIGGVNVDLNLGAFSGQNRGAIVAFDNAKINMLQTCTATGLCQSSGMFFTPGISEAMQGKRAKVSDLNVKFSHGFNADNTMNSSLAIDFSKLDTSVPQPIIKSNMIYKIDEINVAAMNKLIALAKQMKSTSNPAELTQLMQEYKSAIPELITAKTTLTEDITAGTQYGDVLGTAKISWPQEVPLPKTIDDIINKMHYQGQIKVATTFVDNVIVAFAKKQAEAMAQKKSGMVLPSPSQPVTAPKVLKADVMKQMFMLQTQKQINPQTLAMVAGAFQLPEPVDTFNQYVDQRLARQEMSQAVANTIKAQYAAAILYQTQLIGFVFSTPVTKVQDFQGKLQQLSSAGIITDEDAKQISALAMQGFSPDIFAAALNRFVAAGVLSSQLAELINNSYTKFISGAEGDVGLSDSVVESPETIIQKKMNAQMDDFVKQGYLVEGDGIYVVNLDYQGGILKINDKPINVDLSSLFAEMNNSNVASMQSAPAVPATSVAPVITAPVVKH